MAGDWIKMRLDLQTHPKIVRILSAMRPHDVQFKTDKFRVVGGLHAVWSVFDTHSPDGTLCGYTPETLDHIIGWDGFAQAMIDVGWLAVTDGATLVLPEFDEHNGKSGKRRAEDQKRKRDDRKSPPSVRILSANKPDENGTREEKRREDIKTTPGGDLFAGIDPLVANDFKSLRSKQKAPITKTAIDGIRREADKAGVSLEDALRVCCERSWRGFKSEWITDSQGTKLGHLAVVGGPNDPRWKGAK